MHIDQLKEKLLKLSLSGVCAQIITFDNDGYKEWRTGFICYQPIKDDRFQIFNNDGLDLMFKPEAVIRLDVMTISWETHNPVNVINYEEEAR